MNLYKKERSKWYNVEIQVVDKPEKNTNQKLKIKQPSDILEIKDVQEIRKGYREYLLFIGLDRGNNLRNVSLLGIGSTCGVIINTKEIARTALFNGCDKVILVHNHPSNSLKPSKDDLHITNVSNKILEAFGIELLDHIIVTEDEYLSMETAKKIDKKHKTDDISKIDNGLLIEENERLKKQIDELEQRLIKVDRKVENTIEVLSGKCIGCYNDTTMYEIVIKYNNETKTTYVERKYNDLAEIQYSWNVNSEVMLTDNEKEEIIKVISTNPPSIMVDSEAKVYKNNLNESIEIEM